MYCTSLIIIYDETTMSNPRRDHIIHFLAFAGSFPELAAKINISPETISATVTNVPIKNVAESTISCTKSPTDVGLSVIFCLMPKVL